MSFSDEERELARTAAKKAEKLLPALRTELLELEARIRWLESHIETYGLITKRPKANVPGQPDLIVTDGENRLAIQMKVYRAPRGLPKKQLGEIFCAHTDWSNAQIIDETEKKFGTRYSESTAYRALNELREDYHRQMTAEADREELGVS